MHQLTTHISPETALQFDYFPYCFNTFSKIQYWCETRESLGQRFCYKAFNPHTGKWNKQKDTAYTNLVFMFRKPDGLVLEQTISLNQLTDDDILYIVSNYHVTGYQKNVIQTFLNKIKSPLITVWRDTTNDTNTNINTNDIIPLVYDLNRPIARTTAVDIDADAFNNLPSVDQARELKRLKLHTREIRAMPKEQRVMYYALQNKANPDKFTDAYIDSLT